MLCQIQLHGATAIGGDGYQVTTGPQLDIATLIVIGAQSQLGHIGLQIHYHARLVPLRLTCHGQAALIAKRQGTVEVEPPAQGTVIGG